MFLIVTQWMPLRPTADRFNGCFVWALAPFFGLFWCCFAVCLVSAGETQVWLGDLRVVALCVVWFFVWFVLIDLLISRTYVLVQSFSCLLSCKDRALARHRPISRKKNVLSLCPFRYRYPLPCHLACLLALVHLAPCSVTFPTISLNWSGSSWQQPADPP